MVVPTLIQPLSLTQRRLILLAIHCSSYNHVNFFYNSCKSEMFLFCLSSAPFNPQVLSERHSITFLIHRISCTFGLHNNNFHYYYFFSIRTIISYNYSWTNSKAFLTLCYFPGVSRGENVGPSASARAADRRAHHVYPRRGCSSRGQSAEGRQIIRHIHQIRISQFIDEGMIYFLND